MNLQKTTRYALTILSHMALNEKQIYNADRISHDTQIPKRYLRRLMTELTKAGFLTVSRGRSGGFTFSKEIADITLYEIIQWFEEEPFRDQCILGFSFCIADIPCIMHKQWTEAINSSIVILKTTTLGSLKEQYKTRLEQMTK